MNSGESKIKNEKKPQKLFARHILRKVFLEDWLMKLLALAITLGLWFGVTGLSTPTTTRFSNVSLTMQILNNTDITNSPVSEVDIVVSGDARRINRINKSSLAASLDLTSMQPGESTVILSPANIFVDLPTGVKLEDITPNKLLIKLESIEEKEVAVRAETNGEVPDGFEIYNKSVMPARVHVRGPSSLTKSLEFVSTENIDVAGRTSDFTVRQIAVIQSNTKATVQESNVDVTIRIGEKRIEKTFVIPVSGTPAGKKASVTLFGPATLIAKIRPSDLKVEILKSETGEESLQVTLPLDIEDNVEVRKKKLA